MADREFGFETLFFLAGACIATDENDEDREHLKVSNELESAEIEGPRDDLGEEATHPNGPMLGVELGELGDGLQGVAREHDAVRDEEYGGVLLAVTRTDGENADDAGLSQYNERGTQNGESRTLKEAQCADEFNDPCDNNGENRGPEEPTLTLAKEEDVEDVLEIVGKDLDQH